MTELAPKVGGLVEFYRSPARKQWTPTGVNVPDYGKMAQVWWQNVSNAISGQVTPQQAMDGLARDQDAIMARLEKSGVQGKLGPKMNKEKTAEYWYAKAEKDGNLAPQRKLANEKPQGETVDYDALIKSWPLDPAEEGLSRAYPPCGRAGVRRQRRLSVRSGSVRRHASAAHPRHRPRHDLDPRHRVRRRDAAPVATAQQEFPQIYPQPGWVEHDPEEICGAPSLATAREALARGRADAADIAALGIANQRETVAGLGPAHRRADPQRHRLAGPPHRRRLRATGTGRARRAGRSTHRPAARPVFLGHQDRLAARPRRRRARGRASAANSPSARSTASCSGG